MKRTAIALLLLASAVVGCTKDDTTTAEQSQAAQFTAGNIESRVVSSSDTSTTSTWVAGDQIGISASKMYGNVLYTADNTGSSTSFTFADTDLTKEILLPRTEAITYYAYYPYRSDVDEVGCYTSNVSDQSDWSKIDYLIAAGVEGIEGGGAISFSFTHNLAILKLNITLSSQLKAAYTDWEDKFSDYASVTIKDAYLDCRYSTVAGDYITYNPNVIGDLSMVIDGTNQLAKAIINRGDAGTTQSLSLSIVFGSHSYTGTITPIVNAGTIVEYTATLGFEGITLSDEPTITPWGEGEVSGDEFDDMTKLTYGTANNPFLIKSKEDLERVGTNGTSTDTGSDKWSTSAHYKLEEDLALDYTEQLTMAIEDNAFTGDFNGNGKIISDIYIEDDTETGYVGLFNVIGAGGKVYDLTLDNCTIFADSGYVGAIAGYNAGIISGCTVSGYITNEDEEYQSCATGGIAGRSTSLVERCVNSAMVCGYWKVGGVVGYLDEQSVVNCGNTGVVSNFVEDEGDTSYSSQQGTGGVVGFADSKTVVTRCYNQGRVESTCYQTGGVVGYTNGTLTSGCYNSGIINGYDYVGGVVGRVLSVDDISDCYYLTGCLYSNMDKNAADRGIGDEALDTAGTQVKDDDYMESEEFVTALNAVVSPTSSYIDAFTVYDWVLGDTYPITDPNAVAAFTLIED